MPLMKATPLDHMLVSNFKNVSAVVSTKNDPEKNAGIFLNKGWVEVETAFENIPVKFIFVCCHSVVSTPPKDTSPKIPRRERVDRYIVFLLLLKSL